MTFYPTHGERGPRVHFTADDIRELREEALNRRGLYGKFIVFKVDENGKPIGEPITDVFVLRPERDVHALEALRTYARSASHEMSTRGLARDLSTWVEVIEKRAGGPPSSKEAKP